MARRPATDSTAALTRQDRIVARADLGRGPARS
jgi:hypothetical protein